MKITFLGPIMKPDPDRLAEAEAGGKFESVTELLNLLGYPEDQHGLVRVFVEGEPLSGSDPVPETDELMLMLAVGGG